MRKRIILTSAILLVTIIVVLSTSVYAWFNMTNEVIVEDLVVQVEGDKSLLISNDNTIPNWSTSLNLNSVLEGRELSADVSGNGTNLYTIDGEYYGEDGGPLNYKEATNSNINTTTGICDYYEFPVFFKASRNCEIYLSKTSSILPELGPDGTVLIGDDPTVIHNKSDYGNFSMNYIAGAVRVAIWSVASNGDETLVCIWVPNPEYRLYKESAYSFYSFEENGTPETSRNYVYYDNDTSTYNTKTYEDGNIKYITGNNFTYNDDCKVGVINLSEGEEEQIVQIKVRIWIEGTDRESNAALAGGKFITNLTFITNELIGGTGDE